jgi:WD40 repeat protein
MISCFKEHKGPIYDFATNTDGPSSDIIISASYDSSCKLWDRRSDKSQGTFVCETPNFEANLFNSNYLTVGGISLLSFFDIRKFGTLIDFVCPFEDKSVPVRGLSVNSSRTVCGCRHEVSILSRNEEILKQNSILKNTKYQLDHYQSIHKLDQKKILSLYSDDELLICGNSMGVLFVNNFVDGNPKIIEPITKEKNKNCLIQ